MSTPLFALLFCSSIRSKSLNNVRMSSRVVNASFQAQKLRICNAQSTHNPLFFRSLCCCSSFSTTAHSRSKRNTNLSTSPKTCTLPLTLMRFFGTHQINILSALVSIMHTMYIKKSNFVKNIPYFHDCKPLSIIG